MVSGRRSSDGSAIPRPVATEAYTQMNPVLACNPRSSSERFLLNTGSARARIHTPLPNWRTLSRRKLEAQSRSISPEIPFDVDFSIVYTSRLLYRRLFSIWHVMGAD